MYPDQVQCRYDFVWVVSRLARPPGEGSRGVRALPPHPQRGLVIRLAGQVPSSVIPCSKRSLRHIAPYSKMAAQYNSTVAETVALYRPATNFGLECCTVSVIAFVVYDWIVTLSREVDLFWTGKARPLAAILYFSNKYWQVLSYAVSTLELALMSNESCTRAAIVFRLFLYLSCLPPAAFTAMRAYALTRCRWLSALVFLLSSVQFVTNMVGLLGFRVFGVHIPTWGCVTGIAIPPSRALVLILNRVSTIVADTILVVITWKSLPALDIMKHKSRSETVGIRGLASIMLRNGITYFIVLSMLNIWQLVLTVGFSIVPDGVLSYVSYLTPPLSSILVSHFLLDLQEAHQRAAAGMATIDPLDPSRDVGSFSDFPDALGSICAALSDFAAVDGQEEDVAGADDRFVVDSEQDIRPHEGESIHESRNEDPTVTKVLR